MSSRLLKTIVAVCFVVLVNTGNLWAAQLLMLEQKGCHWCQKWDEEIGKIYNKTPEGKQAPLRRVNIHEARPDDLSDVVFDRFTPTFVLIENGMEIARLRGYSGDEYFWFELQQMLDKLPKNEKP